jgi:hypothetical protein
VGGQPSARRGTARVRRGAHRGWRFPWTPECAGKGFKGFDTARETLLRTFAFHRARLGSAKRCSRIDARPRERAWDENVVL